MAHGAPANRPALRAPSPLITPPTSRFTKQQQLPCSPATWPGGTLQEKKNSRVHSGAGKSLVPNPFPGTPRRLTLGARGRRSVRARLCAPNSARRGRGREGAGLQPPRRPPPQLCAQTPCWPPPLHRGRAQPPQKDRLPLAWPRGPGAHKLSPRRQPHAPHSLGPPGSDRCLGDRLSFVPKERGTRAGSPALLVGAPPAAPTSSCHSAAPGPARPPRGGAVGG